MSTMALHTAPPIKGNDFSALHNERELGNSSDNPATGAVSDPDDSPAYSLTEPLTDAAKLNPRLELIELENEEGQGVGVSTSFTPSRKRDKGRSSDIWRRTISLLAASAAALLPIFIVLLLSRRREHSWRKEIRGVSA